MDASSKDCYDSNSSNCNINESNSSNSRKIIVIAIPKPLNGLGSAPLLAHSVSAIIGHGRVSCRVAVKDTMQPILLPSSSTTSQTSWLGQLAGHQDASRRTPASSGLAKSHRPRMRKDVSSAFAVQEVIQEMVAVQAAKKSGALRPIIFSLSNPMTQAEITAEDCYKFSNGKAIFGSGTRFDPVMVQGKTRVPGQVNNFFIFPGMSFGAVCCEAKEITDRLFMEAAEAVANSLDKEDMEADSVLPSTGRIREIGFNVAVKVAMAAQKAG